MGHGNHLLPVLILLCFSLRCESWGWFSSSKENPSSGSSYTNGGNFRGSNAEFSIEAFNDPKGVKLVENAQRKMVGSTNTCWQNAYHHLFAGCSEILAADEKRSRLAWHLSDCFQRDSGRSSFPQCDPKSPIASCLRALDDIAHKVYLEFYLETNSICYQLQTHAFKHDTERLVNDLRSSAQYVEDKLDSIEEKSEHLLQNSKNIHESLDSINIHTQQVAQGAKNVEGHINEVLSHSKSVYEQTTQIAASQSQLKEGQDDMKRNLEDGVAMLKESYDYLGKEIERLRDEAIQIEKEMIKVGDAMSSKMENLQSKTDDIGDMAGISLDKQQQLLNGQSIALDGLNSMTEFQSKALEENRKALQYFAEYGHKQHEQLLQRQEQIQSLHDRLMDNSKSILSAQESFESKQATMFAALEKLSALQNAMLLESRVFKSIFIYVVAFFFAFMFTSMEQTYRMRTFLFIWLFATLLLEAIIIYATNDEIEQQTWMINKIRMVSVVVASAQLLYAICTYKDYGMLTYQLQETIINKVDNMGKKFELWQAMETEDSVDWSKWIDADLPDDVHCLDDPDFMVPEEVAENSITASSTTKSYNLRSRHRFY